MPLSERYNTMNKRDQYIFQQHIWKLYIILVIIIVGIPENYVKTEEVEDGLIENPEPDNRKDGEPFIPTNEWQEIKPGQSIPPGLHVQMNMRTGKNQARLMQPEEGGDQDVAAIDYEIDENESHSVTDTETNAPNALLKTEESDDHSDEIISREDLKEALKQIKAEKIEQRKESGTREKMRSAEELKEELSRLKIDIKTDQEIVSRLVEDYNNTDLTDEERENTLQQLEYYAHQVDNGVLLADNGGINLVVRDLNHTSSHLRRLAAAVIGSAVQSNPRAQVVVLKTGALSQLVKMLSIDSKEVKQTALFALSALVRHFPYAQKLLLQNGGLSALADLFSYPAAQQLQVKAVTLICDLILEQKSILAQASAAQTDSIKIKLEQYTQVELMVGLLEQGWCSLIPRLLGAQDHDSREKTISAMLLLYEVCGEHYTNTETQLQILKKEYQDLAKTEILEEGESPDGYFQHLLKDVESLIRSLLNQKDNISSKEEL